MLISSTRAATAAPVSRSDVVFMYAATDEILDLYGGTKMVWTNRVPAGRFAELRQRGVYAQGSFWLLTASQSPSCKAPLTEDGVILDFRGDPIEVPWLSDWGRRGTRSWWGCTNREAFRKHSRERLQRCMEREPDGLQIDDHAGTAGSVPYGGCFCPDCMEKFRRFLGEGPDFDYRKVVAAHVSTREEYVAKRTTLPLADAFFTFQVREAAAFVGELKNEAATLAGRPIPLSVNASLEWPWQLGDSHWADFFAGETNFGQDGDLTGGNTVLAFKIADALGKNLCATALGENWGAVEDGALYPLVKAWVARAYAFGHQLMVPDQAWTYREDSGGDFLNFPPEILSPVYRFIRDHRTLFDPFETVTQVGLLHSNRTTRLGRDDYRRGDIRSFAVARQLTRASVPFQLLLAGDEWVEGNFTAETLARHDTILVPMGADGKPPLLDEAQSALWQDWLDRGGRAIEIAPGGDAAAGLDSWVSVRNLPKGEAIVRRSGESLMIHLLNRDYDFDRHCFRPAEGVTLELSKNLTGDGHPTDCHLHAPRGANGSPNLKETEKGWRIDLPPLGFWTLVELRLDGEAAI